MLKLRHVTNEFIQSFSWQIDQSCVLVWKTLPKDNFSPESDGSVKPSTAMDAIRTHGIIKLKK